MRPQPRGGGRWRWIVTYDTEIPVAAAHATAEPVAVAAYDSADIYVEAARVDVIARHARITPPVRPAAVAPSLRDYVEALPAAFPHLYQTP